MEPEPSTQKPKPQTPNNLKPQTLNPQPGTRLTLWMYCTSTASRRGGTGTTPFIQRCLTCKRFIDCKTSMITDEEPLREFVFNWDCGFSRTLLGLADYRQADLLGLRDKPVNIGAGKKVSLWMNGYIPRRNQNITTKVKNRLDSRNQDLYETSGETPKGLCERDPFGKPEGWLVQADMGQDLRLSDRAQDIPRGARAQASRHRIVPRVRRTSPGLVLSLSLSPALSLSISFSLSPNAINTVHPTSHRFQWFKLRASSVVGGAWGAVG